MRDCMGFEYALVRVQTSNIELNMFNGGSALVNYWMFTQGAPELSARVRDNVDMAYATTRGCCHVENSPKGVFSFTEREGQYG